MANIITDVKWHDNPRPVASYATSVYDAQVASPYYKDGRDVPVHVHVNTPVPLQDLVPKATIDTAGPAALVDFTIDGVWREPAEIVIYLSLTDTVFGDYDDIIFAGPDLTGPEEAASVIAGFINEHPELTANNEGQKVIVSALAPVTAITITTLTVQ